MHSVIQRSCILKSKVNTLLVTHLQKISYKIVNENTDVVLPIDDKVEHGMDKPCQVALVLKDMNCPEGNKKRIKQV